MQDTTVVVRGGGDIGTGVAHRLFRSGFAVLVFETGLPTVIRRTVAFAQAVYDGRCTVEGVTAVRAETREEIEAVLRSGNVPVLIDPQCSRLPEIQPVALVDAVLAKKNTGMQRCLAPITIGLGPGFAAGEDVDAVIETRRGHNLGRVILEGTAEPDTGVPESIEGFSHQRVLRALQDGRATAAVAIGDFVKQGDVVLYIDREPLPAPFDGVVRGLIVDGLQVRRGAKLGDIDPRSNRQYCFTISDKARAVAGGVLEALLYLKKARKL